MVRIDSVSTATEIHVVGAVLRVAQIIAATVKSTPAECRAGSAALRRVIENHIKDDFNSGAMAGFDHVTELGHRRERVALINAIAPMRGEPRHRLVSPELAQLLACHRVDSANLAGVKLLHRQQLDGGNAERLKIGQLLRQPGICARMSDSGGRVPRETTHV